MTHAGDDGWPLKNIHQKSTAKTIGQTVLGWVKGAVTSVKAAFVLPAPAQLAFA